MPRDYYEVLGLSKDASSKEIKKAYHKLAVQHHPDHNQGDAAAEEKFKELAEAYDVLGNKKKRKDYDAYGHGRQPASGHPGWNPFGGGGHPFGADIFEEFFGRRTRGHRPRNPAGRDIVVEIQIPFLEAAHGTTKEVVIQRSVKCKPCSGVGGAGHRRCDQCHGSGCITVQQGMMVIQTTCNPCNGSGEVIEEMCDTCRGRGDVTDSSGVSVKIPAGISTGNQLRLAGLGHHGSTGAGNLYVSVVVQDHPQFKRKGKNVSSVLGLSISEAVLGCQKVVETVHGNKGVTIPPGSQAGSALRLSQFGITDLNGGPRGDHKLELRVRIPTQLSPVQRELFENLRKAE